MTKNLSDAVEHFSFSSAALACIESADADSIADCQKIIDGRTTPESLLAIILDVAPAEQEQGWIDYVYELARIADLTR